ncbi:MAG: NAD(P)/FAD-dependent oxidoreductase [Thermodesulfobacteriota bacterium]|nr:NAD(P)/FAD-dependent oxidoreductase [Thermodesulfobacteriota bacterium]
MADNKYDVIIVGGGHNGLTCGAYLARAGKKVIVLEARHIYGGGVITEEVTLPGFRHNMHSYQHTWIFMGPVYSDLELQKYGSKYIFPPSGYALLFEDGESMIGYAGDFDRTCKEIGRFSKKDEKAYRELYNFYKNFKDIYVGFLFNPPLPFSKQYSLLEDTPYGREVIRTQMVTMEDIVDEYFEHDRVKTFFCFMGGQSGMDHITIGGGAIFMAMTVEWILTGSGCSVGGSQSLSDAIVRALEAYGGEVRLNCKVKKFIVEKNEVKGVEVEDGSKVYADTVVTNLNPRLTFGEMIDQDILTDDVIKVSKRWKREEGTLFTIHLALDEAPKWIAKNPDFARTCYVFGIGVETMEQLTSQILDIKRGVPPKDLGYITAVPSVFDPSYAPPGKHTFLGSQFAGYMLKEGPEKWDELKEEYGDKMVQFFQKFAPNITSDKILGRYYDTPIDIERRNPSMYQGSMSSGAYTPDQMGVFRCLPGYPTAKTPIKGLYRSGPSSHPGGGCSGGAGYIAANVIAEDMGITKWWKTPAYFGGRPVDIEMGKNI